MAADKVFTEYPRDANGDFDPTGIVWADARADALAAAVLADYQCSNSEDATAAWVRLLALQVESP